ncbi:MAG: hypothetical protein IT338_20695 [Thermomicrobiales bacterium]|nr:hypothetical protein [Thermomicrobiales bacterium]
MDNDRFDRLTRSIATGITRRRLVAAAVGALALRGSEARAQLGPATCGQAGAVCTMLMGCCQGLTCVTSAINVNYGVCVTGSGGTVSTGTTLISPFSDGAVEEAAGLASTSTTTTSSTTDPQALRQQKIAQRKSRRSARKSKQSSRRSTRKTNRQTQQDQRRLRRGPRLTFQVTGQGTTDEALRVTNRENQTAVLFGIAPLGNLSLSQQLTPPYSLGPGLPFLFLSGQTSELDGNRVGWIANPICQGDLSQNGFIVTAAFSSTSTKSREYTILCDGSRLTSGHRKRNNNQHKRHKKRSQKQKSGTHD